ncbi:MAG: hypothetical protein AAGG59_19130 [Bacteroidota bacterium]
MKNTIYGFLILGSIAYAYAFGNIQNEDNYQLVWSDEFEYEGFADSTKWSMM